MGTTCQKLRKTTKISKLPNDSQSTEHFWESFGNLEILAVFHNF